MMRRALPWPGTFNSLLIGTNIYAPGNVER